MKTHLDWSSYEDAGMGDAYADIPKTGGDFAKAVAVCIGSHQCENTDKGVMCPSYRISEKADFSTGGRVRLLKAALNGELGETPFADPGLAEAMDLCVSCKGCKRECENEVDMALIKVEYLAQRNALSGRPLRSRFLASLPQWLHRWPTLRRFIGWRNSLPWLAKLGEKGLGISARRPVPKPAARPFPLTPDNGQPYTVAAGQPEDNREVVLFIDTFTRHFEPAIAYAAVEVLQTAGYHLIFAQPGGDTPEPNRPLCCGRTFLAHGMIEEARSEAQRLVDVLLPHAQAGRSIVGLEPSCLLSLRDEYLTLGLGEEAKLIAQHTLLFEEFLAKEYSAKRLNLELKPSPEQAAHTLVHGHCHQKAVGAMKSMRKVLKLIPGLKFEMIEASCCGMAGSFGLEAEHADIAQQMAEQSLLPAIRQVPEATVLANGFSCRQQILAGLAHPPATEDAGEKDTLEGSQRRPIHIAELLRDALA